MPKVQQRHNISNEDFIKAWQSSAQFDDVVKTLGVTARYASSRAFNLRKRKVELKHFRRRESFDAKAIKVLNELAKKSLKN